MPLMTAVMLMIGNKDKVISQDGGVVCLSKGINADLVLKLNKGTIMCVRELLRNHFCP